MGALPHGALAQIQWCIPSGGEKMVCQRICMKTCSIGFFAGNAQKSWPVNYFRAMKIAGKAGLSQREHGLFYIRYKVKRVYKAFCPVKIWSFLPLA